MKSKLASKQLKQFFTSVFFLTVFLLSLEISAQTEDSLLVYQENSSYNIAETENFSEINFTEVFEINENTLRNGITLNDARLLKKPYANSESANVLIPKGTNIKTYKLLVKEGYWVVNYKDNWGFIPLSSVMQIKDDQNANTLSKCDIPPKLRSGLNFDFLAGAKLSSTKGEVVFNILIDKNGKVKKYHLLKGIPELNDAATDEIKKLKFKPGIYKGKPIEVWMRYPVSFNNK